MSDKNNRNTVEFGIGDRDYFVRGNLSREMLLAVGSNAAQDRDAAEHSKETIGPDGSKQKVMLGTLFNVPASGNDPMREARTGWVQNTAPDGKVTTGTFYISTPMAPTP